MASTYLSNSAIKGLTRIGDILVPGNDEFPSFSAFMCMDHIDGLVSYAPADDIKDPRHGLRYTFYHANRSIKMAGKHDG